MFTTKSPGRYSFGMTIYETRIVFPDGDTQEIGQRLGVSDIVDHNGNPLSVPLQTNRMLAYQVERMRTTEERGVHVTWYFLVQLSSNDLMEYT